jgi:hypothetical protein
MYKSTSETRKFISFAKNNLHKTKVPCLQFVIDVCCHSIVVVKMLMINDCQDVSPTTHDAPQDTPALDTQDNNCSQPPTRAKILEAVGVYCVTVLTTSCGLSLLFMFASGIHFTFLTYVFLLIAATITHFFIPTAYGLKAFTFIYLFICYAIAACVTLAVLCTQIPTVVTCLAVGCFAVVLFLYPKLEKLFRPTPFIMHTNIDQVTETLLNNNRNARAQNNADPRTYRHYETSSRTFGDERNSCAQM